MGQFKQNLSPGCMMLFSTSITCPLTPKVKFNNHVIRRFSFMSDPLNSVICLKFKQTQFVLVSFQYGGPVLANDTGKEAPTSVHLLQDKDQTQRPTLEEVKPSSWLLWELLKMSHACNKWAPLNKGMEEGNPCAEQCSPGFPHSLPPALFKSSPLTQATEF